jgi:hypothetical protein
LSTPFRAYLPVPKWSNAGTPESRGEQGCGTGIAFKLISGLNKRTIAVP